MWWKLIEIRPWLDMVQNSHLAVPPFCSNTVLRACWCHLKPLKLDFWVQNGTFLWSICCKKCFCRPKSKKIGPFGETGSDSGQTLWAYYITGFFYIWVVIWVMVRVWLRLRVRVYSIWIYFHIWIVTWVPECGMTQLLSLPTITLISPPGQTCLTIDS